MGGWIHTLTLDPINAGTAQIMANIHIKAAIITVTSVVRLPVTPVNISNKNKNGTAFNQQQHEPKQLNRNEVNS